MLLDKIPDDFILIKASGNGSCGPNALAIIFTSHILYGTYSKYNIDLSEFVIAWNHYYPHDTIIMEQGHSTQSVMQKIKEKVAKPDFSFKDCEAIIAPIIRFYFMLYSRINTDEPFISVHEQSQKTLSNLFDVDDQLIELACDIKMDMSKKVLCTRYSNGCGTDNSPSFRSFFGADAMNQVAVELLKLDINYSLKGPFNADGSSYAESIKALHGYNTVIEQDNDSEILNQMTPNTIAWIGPEHANDHEIKDGQSIPAYIVNYNNTHFNAVLPKHVINACSAVKGLYSNHCQGKRLTQLSDEEIYNPCNIPQPKPQARKKQPIESGVIVNFTNALMRSYLELCLNTVLPAILFSLLFVSACCYFAPVITLSVLSSVATWQYLNPYLSSHSTVPKPPSAELKSKSLKNTAKQKKIRNNKEPQIRSWLSLLKFTR